MKNLNPEEFLEAYKEGGAEYIKENFVDYFREESSVNHLFDIYTFLEGRKDKRANELKILMEETVGKNYIEKYGIVPKEAMGLEFLEKSFGLEMFNRDDIPSPHHVHSLFRIHKENYIIDLDIVEISCPEVKFLKLFPNLEMLTICMAGLKEIEGLESLIELRLLDLGSNELTEIKGLKHLKKLKQLFIHCNKISKLSGLESLEDLEELLIQGNPISKLKGIKSLKKLRHIEFDDTNLDMGKFKKKIHAHIKRNRLRITKEKNELLQSAERLMEKGDYSKAIGNYEEAGRLSESLFPIGWGSQHFLSSKDWYNLAIAYIKVKSYKAALRSCTQAIKLNSKDKAAQELRKTIINLNEEFKS